MFSTSYLQWKVEREEETETVDGLFLILVETVGYEDKDRKSPFGHSILPFITRVSVWDFVTFEGDVKWL